MTIYYIVNWPYHEHREMPKHAAWVKAKVDFQGSAWVRLSAHPDCSDALATWEIIRGLALLSPFRGLLLTNDGRPRPMTATDIAAHSRWKVDAIERGLAALVTELGWVSVLDIDEKVLAEQKRNKCAFVAASLQCWSQVYGVQGLIFAPIPRQRRAVTAPTGQDNTIHNKTGKESLRKAPREDRTSRDSARPTNPTASCLEMRGRTETEKERLHGFVISLTPAAWRKNWGESLRTFVLVLLLKHGAKVTVASIQHEVKKKTQPETFGEMKRNVMATIKHRWYQENGCYESAITLLRKFEG